MVLLSRPAANPGRLLHTFQTLSGLCKSSYRALTLMTPSAGRVFVWDAASAEQRQGLEGPGEAVNWLQWHPRGNVLLAGSEDFTAWLWNAQTGACMHVRCHFTQMSEACQRPRACMFQLTPLDSSRR